MKVGPSVLTPSADVLSSIEMRHGARVEQRGIFRKRPSSNMQTSHAIELGQNGNSIGLGPRSPAPPLPLARLLQLLMILQSERFPNARRLAEVCEVSRRTIYRDLATLEAAGIDVLYQPERQGYQLARNCWLQPTQLAENEALALLILSRTKCSGLPAGLVRHAQTGLAKVVQSLPGDLGQRMAISGELLVDDAVPGTLPPDRQSVHETIYRAMSERKRLTIWYSDNEREPMAATDFGLYRLARNRRQWCLVGHSAADRKVRVFEIARIERLELTDEPYSIPPRFRVERFLERSNCERLFRDREARLRLSPRAAEWARETLAAPDQRQSPGPDGAIDLFVSVAHVDDLVPWLTFYGDQVEVIEPEELRSAVREWAERIARVHGRWADENANGIS
jgi:predicted DNA-binding transcriptional regulator YafY